ncbi:hypothetical protein NQ317_004275 [Molorchus minor]|uniref:Uncharacterized protein n=1 Tax=Molorchus minor TaxID=1323400 RepID=A0ABQ9IRS2_9CUCU|nr:hypothetical protein NQ317_004275 [Molorchus minor]
MAVLIKKHQNSQGCTVALYTIGADVPSAYCKQRIYKQSTNKPKGALLFSTMPSCAWTTKYSLTNKGIPLL